MTVDTSGEKEYTCKVRNPSERKGTVFQVTLEGILDGYVALIPRANVSLLPSYL
jgi:hypothetical protein